MYIADRFDFLLNYKDIILRIEKEPIMKHFN